VTTAGLAETESDWQRLYDNPPTADTILAGLQHYASAFELFGEGHRFCQHQAVVEDDDRQRIASILIDGPSDESDVRNHDVMMDIVGFSPTTAALARSKRRAARSRSGHVTLRFSPADSATSVRT
jgi:hypothetical protein